MIRSFQHEVQDVEDVLAQSVSRVLGLESGVGTVASGHVRDDDAVDVASGASELDLVVRTVVTVGVAIIFVSTVALKDEHLLASGAVEEGIVRFRLLRNVTVMLSAILGYSRAKHLPLETRLFLALFEARNA